MKNARKKSIAVLAGLSVAGLVGASAASLGGVESNNLGADAGVIGSCDTDGVTVAYDLTGTNVTNVTIGGVADACGGQDATVTIFAGNGDVLGSGASNGIVLAGADADDKSFDVGVTPADAERARRVAIAISGAPAAP